MFLEALDNQTRSVMFEPANAADPLDTATTTIPTIQVDHHHHNNNNINNNNIHHNYAATTASLQALPCFNDLIAVLIECFSLIAIGYLSGRFRVLSPDAKDLGAYLTTFALPMIIFLNVAQMEIQTINVSFLVCMLVSKLIIFLLVSLVTLAISYPSNFSYAGALSILSTQSNDFALGYPLFKSLYGESKPEMLNYLNLMGPIQLLIINPLGIVMLEFGKSQLKRQMRRRQAASSTPPPKPASARQPGQCALHGPANSVINQTTVIPFIGHHHHHRDQQVPTSTSINFRVSGEAQAEVLRRKNCKSLMLVMPGRLVSSCSLSDESVSSLDFDPKQHQQQQVTMTKSLSPNLLGDLSADDLTPAVPTRRNWIAAIGLGNCGRPRPEAPQPLRGCTCWPEAPASEHDKEEPLVDWGFLWALMTNPLIIVSLLALAVNLLHGPQLPKFVTKVSNTIAASFAAPALIVVGLSMYGKFKLILRNPNDLLLASALVMTKVLVLPNIMRTVMQLTLPYYIDAAEIPHLLDFSYLYGLLPTAPGACIIAKQYEVLTNVVSISMLLSTFFSAPLMLGTSVVISKAASITPDSMMNMLGRVLKVSSSLTITLSFLTLYLLWKMHKKSLRSLGGVLSEAALFKSRYLFTILLTITQLFVGIGGFLWMFVDTTKIKPHLSLFQESDGLATDVQSVTIAPDTNWPRAEADIENDEEDYVVGDGYPLGQEERFHSLGSSRVITHSGSHSFSLGFHSLSSAACTMGFIQASGGLLLAKFVIFCITIINFTRHSRGHQMASRVSSLMTRLIPLLAMGSVTSLIFESKHLTCQPNEASLPSWSFSLYLRLMFNVVLLALALSLFVATFRLKNMTAQRRADELLEASSTTSDNEGMVASDTAAATVATSSSSNRLKKCQFGASSVSLSSGTSSELTTSTNIESNALATAGPSNSPKPVHKSHTIMTQQANLATPTINQQAANAANILIDCGRLYEQKIDTTRSSSRMGPTNSRNSFVDANNNNQMAIGDTNDTEPVVVYAGAALDLKATRNQQRDLLQSSPSQQQPDEARTRQGAAWPATNVEFDRNSVLVVFMLFQALISITSTLQILFQDRQTTGSTFIMVELTNLVVDVGQGLVTFLVIGTQILSRKLG